MNSVTFDTLSYSKRLVKAGADPKLADEIAEAQQEYMQEILGSYLATKSDLKDLASKSDITEIDKRLIAVETELKAVKWIMSTIGVGVLLLVIKSFLS